MYGYALKKKSNLLFCLRLLTSSFPLVVLVSYSNPHKSEVIKCWKAVVCSLSSFLLASRNQLIRGRFSSWKLMAQILVIMLREKWMLSTIPLQRCHWSEVGCACVTPCLELLEQHGLSSKVFSFSHWGITDLRWQSSQLYFFRERGSSRGLLWAPRCQLWCQETSGGPGCAQSLGVTDCRCWQAREEPRTCPWVWWCGMGTIPLLPLSCFQGLAVTWGCCRVTSPTWC